MSSGLLLLSVHLTINFSAKSALFIVKTSFLIAILIVNSNFWKNTANVPSLVDRQGSSQCEFDEVCVQEYELGVYFDSCSVLMIANHILMRTYCCPLVSNDTWMSVIEPGKINR